MTAKLTEAMRHSAGTVTAYTSYDAVITRAGRRRRRRRILTVAAAAVLALGLGLFPLVAPTVAATSVAGPPDQADASASLPDRVGAPLWGTASVQKQPLRAASVIFTSRLWWLDGATGEVALVGASTDDYRLVSDPAIGPAGERVLLSPDGSRLAMSDQVVRLSDGQRWRLPQPDGTEAAVPAAWSPNGDTLAVLGTTIKSGLDGNEPDRTIRAVLSLVDLGSGHSTTIAELEPRNVADGFTVAFAPDGDALAYQSGDSVVVVDVAGAVRSRFTVPTNTRLAGKGAWTPDGKGLTLVTQRRCCDGDNYPSRWQLHVMDLATGQDLPGRELPEQVGLVALRLMGWAPNGAAVIARYHPEPDAPVRGFDAQIDPYDQITDANWVTRADVAAIRTGAPPKVLVATEEDEVQAIDVADEVIASGQTRAGHPPTGLGPYTKLLLAIVSVVVMVFVVGMGLLIRLTRRSKK